MEILGIDIGGTGTKGGLVNIQTGEMISERFRLDTPQPSTPENVVRTATEVVRHFDYTGPIGCGFPAIIKNGVALSAANVDKNWIGTNAAAMLKASTGSEIYVCNDADLAGLAEMSFGAGKGEMGVVLMITVGTGLGSALFIDGHLVPNTEFGHLYLKNMKHIAEKYSAASAKNKEGLTWEEWALRFNKFLALIERTFSPDLIIIGGGASKKWKKYEHILPKHMRIKPAEMLNNSGIIGAAVFAHQQNSKLKGVPAKSN